MPGDDSSVYPSITSDKAFAEFVMTKVRQALREILIDTVHIEFDAFGQALLSELEYACQRGLEVHCLIDAAGSQNFINDHPALFTKLHTQIRVQHLRAPENNHIVFDRALAVTGNHPLCAANTRSGFQTHHVSRIITGPAAVAIAQNIDAVWENSQGRNGG